MMKNKGLVVKSKGTYCIVATKDGTYHKVPGAGRRVGQEIEFSPAGRSGFLRMGLMAASVLIFVLSFSLSQMSSIPATFAYVTLDINPSLELEIDKDHKVLDMRMLNPDAERYFSDLELQGTDLYETIDLIVDESIKEGLIKPGQEAYVLSTVTLNNPKTEEIDNQLASTIAGKLETTVKAKNLDVKLVVLATDNSLRNEAKKKGLSTGKMAVYQEESDAGNPISLEDVKEHSLTELVKVGTVKLLPNGKKVIVKNIPIHAETNNGHTKTEKSKNKNDVSPAKKQKKINGSNVDHQKKERNKKKE